MWPVDTSPGLLGAVIGDHGLLCLQAMGIGRGEAMPVTQLEPPPTFPPIENQVEIQKDSDNLIEITFALSPILLFKKGTS